MEKTVTIKKRIVTTGGATLAPGTYAGRYIQDGGILHELAAKLGDIYRVYRVPCVKVINSEGYIFNLTGFDSPDIPSTPKTLVSERKLLHYVGSQPVYEDLP